MPPLIRPIRLPHGRLPPRFRPQAGLRAARLEIGRVDHHPARFWRKIWFIAAIFGGRQLIRGLHSSVSALTMSTIKSLVRQSSACLSWASTALPLSWGAKEGAALAQPTKVFAGSGGGLPPCLRKGESRAEARPTGDGIGAPAPYFTGLLYVIRRMEPDLERIRMVSSVIQPGSRLMPARSDPLVTPVAAKITSARTRSSRV